MRRLGFTRRGGPSLATLHRVLHQVPLAELEAAMGQWLRQVRVAWAHGPSPWLDGIAIDGKTVRAARRLGAHDVHLLSAHRLRRRRASAVRAHLCPERLALRRLDTPIAAPPLFHISLE